MAGGPKRQSLRVELFDLLAMVPRGRVVSAERLGEELGIAPPLVSTMLSQLSDDERERIPWHRVVARGGAIGRGLHRDRQFAVLVREGLPVSPAGIVQDLPRRMLTDFTGPTRARDDSAETPAALSAEGVPAPHRSRGMKSHR